MKRKLLYLFVYSLFFLVANNAISQTIYASKKSGNWSGSTDVWETYNAGTDISTMAIGSGTATSATPSGTHSIYIRANHIISMFGSNRSCYSMTIENNGKLWANEAAARRIQFATGGTGFTYPIDVTITNNGTIGGPGDGIYFETPVNARNITLTGSGTSIVGRLRMLGGAGSAAGGIASFTLDQDVTFTQSGNYALSAIYTPTGTDNYTITINTGKTITVSDASGYFHNNGSSAGTYTYNINGTLDLSASTQTLANVSQINVTGGGVVNLNVNGLIKAGAFFKATGTTGTANLQINTNGIFDASLTTDLTTTDTWFKALGALKRKVGNSDVLFPVGTSTAYNPVTLNNSGTLSDISVKVKNTFDNAPSQPTQVVNKQWNIIPSTTGSNLAVTLGWSTADQAASFDAAMPIVIGEYTGTSWAESTATISGATSPYTATISGVTIKSPNGNFAVGNTGTLPLDFLSFTAKPDALGKTVNLNWSTTNEINTKNFEIQKRTDVSDFKTIGTVNSKNVAGIQNYSFADANLNSGTSYYRLNQVDNDGKSKFSGIVPVNIKSAISLSIYPNPAENTLNVSHPAASNKALIKVLSLDGKTMFQQSLSTSSTLTQLDVSQLASGSYLILLEDQSEKSSLKFIKK
ncbi:hypothetical protein A5893_16245 [Pedobacter psychrophilus]|uniref:Secretion system C-terminal sorting domain-containing protein n=1 Tax=Pedobacter psychrophilus TaxID=1826909 RepID=A0A179DA51_9SPHI|nr:T9SS type A sorting domain-containing protein [Pedobacter psychrophilus]OAQ37921.1 hypothetical protein A5893_16245 [Pedobacter psychrophilus]